MSKHNRHNNKKKRKESAPNAANQYTGRLDVTRSGMGFVIVEGQEQDVLVRPSDFNTALHGDTVRVRVTSTSGKSGRRQGVVTEVVERKQTEFLGHLELSQSFAFFIADTDKPMPDIYVPLSRLNGAVHNDRVIVRITEWEKNKKPQGEVIQVMVKEDSNDQAMKELLLENGFPIFFPEDVLEASERLPDIISAAEIAKRKDVRNILTFTIDPVDAKDFDDAISIRTLKNGNLEIGVHIADVSHYVEPETALDKEAYARATSVYLPDRVNPMLPERISNELCSLRPHEDKLTFSAIFQMTDKGEVKQHWIGRTVIHSDHRFTYEDVQEIIEQKAGLHQPEIEVLNDIAQRLRKQRFKKGAINFSSTEVRFKLDEKGKPIGIMVKESKEAHQLVEEFMLLANRTVAEYVGKIRINKKPIPFPYRVHDTPDKEKLQPFMEFARKFGHQFDTSSPQAISESFNQMLRDVQGRPEQHVLETLGIRTMAKAIYTTENIGHYGLGFEHYCHFTSPIRRYPDVMVHRIVEECLQEKIEIDKKLEAKCRHTSERERAAMDSERAANKYKQVEYMQSFLGEEFEGVISGVASFGFWVETVEHKCEGLVSINSLLNYDDFRHVESDYMLVGRRSGRQFRIGDKVTIRVISANLDKRQLDYEWVVTGLARPQIAMPAGETTGSAPAFTSAPALESTFASASDASGNEFRKHGKPDRSHKHDKFNKPGKSNKRDRFNKPGKFDKRDRFENSNRSDNASNAGNSNRFDKPLESTGRQGETVDNSKESFERNQSAQPVPGTQSGQSEQPIPPIQPAQSVASGLARPIESPASDKPARTDNFDKFRKPGKSEKSGKDAGKSARPGKSDKSAGPGKSDRSVRSVSADKSAYSEKPDRAGKLDRTAKFEKPGKSAKSDKPGKSSKPDKFDSARKSDKASNSAKSDKPGKSDKVANPVLTGKPAKSDKALKSDKPAKPAKPAKSDKSARPKAAADKTKKKAKDKEKQNKKKKK